MQTEMTDNILVKAPEPRVLQAGRDAMALAQNIQRKGWAFLKVSGKSMFPWIREADVVFLRKASVEEVVRGDVIVFERNGLLCMHRVLLVGGSESERNLDIAFVTKGDATTDADEPVSSNDFRGRVEFVFRRNREISIARGWRKQLGKFLALISPAVRWWRPLASVLGRGVAHCEVLAVPNTHVLRSSEHSAD